MVSQAAAPGAAFKVLSPNEAIQFILADIPNFCVGILALGTFTFFLLMKRVDRWIFCLHVSVLLAFLAAIFDLSQLLIQGRSSNNGLTPAGVSGLTTVREVFYSFANGLRFLFYWGFVATIPLGETVPEGNKMHSGSWRRWGLMGLVLKWSTLLLVLLTTILQLAFRDVSALEQIGPVYEAESTLEIILSAIFILKLLLNTWARFSVGSNTLSRGKMMMQYAPIIVSLLFSLWIAVGNVILFEFTETALGRFMRAVEFYIAIVYMLTISFHHLRHLSFFPVYRPASRPNTVNKRSSIDKPRMMMVKNEPKQVDLVEVLEERYRGAQEIPQTVERNSARSAKVESSNQHQSMAARLSTWLGVGRPQSNVQSWDVDTERGPSPVLDAVITPWYAPEQEAARAPTPEGPAQPALDEDERRGVSPLPDYTPTETKPREPLPSSDNTYAPRPLDADELEPAKTPVPNRNWQDVEYSNAVRYSGVNQDVLANALSQRYYKTQDDSPIASNIQVVSPPSDDEASMRRNSIGANSEYMASPYPSSPMASAVTPLPRSRPLPVPDRPTSMLMSPMTSVPPDSARSSNMSILLRRQDELDKSIAALRLFSPTQPQFNVDQAPDDSAEYEYQYAEGSSAQASIGHSPMSAAIAYAPSASPEVPLTTPRTGPQWSAQSEFQFDQQPPLNRSSMDSGVIPTMSLPVVNQAPSSLALPRAPTSRFSDGSSVGERERRIDSMGTQYDITSFVGNLTVPVNPKDSVMSATSVAYSDEGMVNVATVAQPPTFARPTLITQQLAASVVPRGDPNPSMSPYLSARRALPPIPQPAAQPQPQPAAGSPAPLRFRRAVGLPANPKLQLATRNLTPVDEKTRSPTDTTTLETSPQSGSGTPMTGKAW
ncbi:hypothetical protein BD311DRAFT_773259 [Dichomitus squalens]|uniref:Uncharacterized protein n=1 Tax=Dichomitus squalens TaxID=114155 RepID=A0A4Q9N4F7_9APHY|nr:hypothetical protein BD311DRAFT_773259 [Dichomitus squalens]